MMIRKEWVVGVAMAIAGCGGGAPKSAGAPHEPPESVEPQGTAGVELPTWMVGHWEGGDGMTETWVAVGDILVGVGVGMATASTEPPDFEVMMVHREGTELLYTAMPNGLKSVDFAATEPGGTEIVFVNPTHDFPQRIGYRRDGEKLEVTLAGGPKQDVLPMTRGVPVAADPLMTADQDFAAASQLRGGAAWAERFVDQGASWPRGSDRTVGPAAVAAMIDEMAADGIALRWAPSAAGLGSAGSLGFTSGPYQVVRTGAGAEETASRGVYVTVWWRVGETWRILFDTGVSTAKSAPAP